MCSSDLADFLVSREVEDQAEAALHPSIKLHSAALHQVLAVTRDTKM